MPLPGRTHRQGCNRADAQARQGRVVFKLISTRHDRVSCLISARHGMVRALEISNTTRKVEKQDTI